MRDYAVLTAIGVRREDGKRMILGVSAALSEAEPHWRSFLMSLKQRGIGIPDSVTSDGACKIFCVKIFYLMYQALKTKYIL